MLNLQYRGADRTTDVLSFPQDDPVFIGDIVINVHKAERQASEYGLTFNEELNRLLIHGLLHLIGYDHEKSRYYRSKMETKERELLDALRCS